MSYDHKMSSSLIVSKKKPPTIPDFPGLPSTKKEAPIPPRYLEVKNASGKVETIEVQYYYSNIHVLMQLTTKSNYFYHHRSRRKMKRALTYYQNERWKAP